MSTPFESKPRWPGAPPICIAENLLAHQSLDALNTFMKRNCPSMNIKETWLCTQCACWHGHATGCDPTGASSGTGRSSK